LRDSRLARRAKNAGAVEEGGAAAGGSLDRARGRSASDPLLADLLFRRRFRRFLRESGRELRIKSRRFQAAQRDPGGDNQLK
jgi:hypothetical protein